MSVKSVMEMQLYEQMYMPTIVELQERRSKLATDEHRAKYVRKLISVYRKQQIDAHLMALNTSPKKDATSIYRLLGLDHELELVQYVRCIVQDNDVCQIVMQIRTQMDDGSGIPQALRDRLGYGKASETFSRNMRKIESLHVGQSSDTLKFILSMIGLETVEEVCEGICNYINTVSPLMVDDLMTYNDKVQGWFDKYLEECEITVRLMDEVFQVGAKMGFHRTFRRRLYRLITVNGMITESLSIGLAKLQFVFGLIYANVTSQFLAKHVQTFSTTLTDDVFEIWLGLKQWAIACSMVALLAFIVYEGMRAYNHIPRFCRRRNPFALAKLARRNRKWFTTCIMQDAHFDDESSTYQFEYDSENDDPDVAVFYYHLREREKARTHLEVSKEQIVTVNNVTGCLPKKTRRKKSKC